MIARWTGRGDLAELRSSVEFVLRSNRLRGKVWTVGDSVIDEGTEPLRAAAALAHMPGVAWVAVGMPVKSMKEAGLFAGRLGVKYLKRGDRFAVEGEGTRNVVGADVAGAVTSGILEAVKGARVSEAPRVRFRAAFDGRKGVVGVQVATGPGGVSTGKEWVTCLVSGGLHSSVLAWTALLMGYRVRLVHAETGERGLLAVARLYAELSHRVDSRGLRLEVLKGGALARVLASHLSKSGEESFAGFHSTGGRVTGPLARRASAPLYLMPEELFRSEFDALGIRGDDSRADWGTKGGAEFAMRTFEGWAEDVSAVLDGLR